MGIEGNPRTSGSWWGSGQSPDVTPILSPKTSFSTFGDSTAARILSFGDSIPQKPKRQRLLGGFGRCAPACPVLGLSSASPQVFHRVLHSSVGFVDKLWIVVDNLRISVLFPVFTGFFRFSQKSLIAASARLFPRDKPRPALRLPDRTGLCRSQTSARGQSAR